MPLRNELPEKRLPYANDLYRGISEFLWDTNSEAVFLFSSMGLLASAWASNLPGYMQALSIAAQYS
jgi:hypothetical protein